MKYPDNISYSYQLGRVRKNWNDIGNQRTATYTNLPKGHYTLKVRSTNSDGVWVENTRTLHITVLPSFWETPWAYLLYVLFILLVIFTAAYILFTIFFRLKHKVSVEQEISDIKLRFFTNISHELRTPLTLIAGPIEHVLQHGKLDNEEREQLMLVERNTNRMLRLVNQILDFRKIQHKKMKMSVPQLDLIPLHPPDSGKLQQTGRRTSNRLWNDYAKSPNSKYGRTRINWRRYYLICYQMHSNIRLRASKLELSCKMKKMK